MTTPAHHDERTQAYELVARRGVFAFGVAQYVIIIGMWWSAWYMLAYVAICIAGYFWARVPLLEFRKRRPT